VVAQPPAPPAATSASAIPDAVPAPVTAEPGEDKPVSSPTQESDTAASSSPTNEFAVRLLHRLGSEPGNVFFSAVSLHNALGIAALGAQGTTLDEMTHVLGLARDPSQNAKQAKKLTANWKRAAGRTELFIANRLWIDKAFEIAQPFRTLAETGYGASPAALDFAHAQEQSRQTINHWVADATRGKFPDSLAPGFIAPLTRLVITNAIYFKGKWATAFDAKKTAPGSFLTNAGVTTTTMMHKTLRMGYFANFAVRVGTLGYRDSDLAMVVVLPSDGRPLREIEETLTAVQLDEWQKASFVTEVNVTMPKFTFVWGRSVVPELKAMGIRTAFGQQADFSALVGDGSDSIYIDDVLHKAFVLVDEAGTEAAAVTHVLGNARSLRVPLAFTVDRPFLFFIRNQRTGDLLFTGRVVNPKPA
jgi:serpin B